MTEFLSHINLTPADIAALPATIRKKIGSAFGPVDKITGEWMLVVTKTERDAALVNYALRRLPAVAAVRAAAIQESNIDRLLDIIAGDMPYADIDAALELENAQMRSEYLRDMPLLTAAKVREQSGRNPRNKSEPASRWKREGRIFAVRKDGISLYPAFQFRDGEPLPVIRQILSALPDDLSPWQIAFWFDSGNGWLDGVEPQECLDQADTVIAAARHLADPAIG